MCVSVCAARGGGGGGEGRGNSRCTNSLLQHVKEIDDPEDCTILTAGPSCILADTKIRCLACANSPWAIQLSAHSDLSVGEQQGHFKQCPGQLLTVDRFWKKLVNGQKSWQVKS